MRIRYWLGQFLHEADVYDSLVDVLTQRLSSARLSQLGTLSPEIVDARALTAESLVLLVSFARPVQASSSRIARSTNTQAGYALVTWTRGAIDTCRILSFTNVSERRALCDLRVARFTGSESGFVDVSGTGPEAPFVSKARYWSRRFEAASAGLRGVSRHPLDDDLVPIP